MYDEWKNELLRESVAKASLIRVRKVHSSTYFTKGKLNELGYFLKENDKINVVFVNATLTAMQQKKLEKRWNDIILSREEKLRRYYLKSAQKEKFNPTDVESESSQMSELETQHQQSGGTNPRKIRVVDRFGIILQIFAARAKTRAAQLQLELAWLKYARTMLVRGGAPTFGQLGSIFQGNMMRAEMVEVGIKSAKGRKSGSGGTIGGEGETQLEMERRKLTDRESKITEELSNLLVRKAHESKKRDQAHQTLPLIALIGYTNAGKTALINLTTGSHLESKDLLFQTLNTTHKRFRLPNGQMALMLDTVGFITSLPHGLVESFKTTLDEIHNAELLVHVRDISHPQTNYQRDTVIKVLKEIGVPDEVFENKYLEVWNKIDLLEDSGELLQSVKQDMEATQQSYPVIMMSCKNGTNKEQFLGQIQNLTAELMGKETVELEYEYHMHSKVTKWLNEHANLTSMEDFQYTDDGKIILKVPIDEVTHQKYLKHFEEKKFQQGQEEQGHTRGRGMKPPPGWSNQ
ncbi:hypothetical protein FGO68_gene7971 [Halteria grandinella]|uniref:Hflx-type G domain-containing protein n=1 Tax=Halteria grandinella TaxID=5974 RepID=A0A8J8NGM4_HALGN|nr:hypothetical protein FGO68_gene7971 [Halteria grandinella]